MLFIKVSSDIFKNLWFRYNFKSYLDLSNIMYGYYKHHTKVCEKYLMIGYIDQFKVLSYTNDGIN